MAEEHVRAFFKKVEEDENLRDRYQSLLKGMADSEVDEDHAMKEVVQFASLNGYEFTSEDAKLVAESMQGEELSDEELEVVAGGTDWLLFTSLSGSESRICFIVGWRID